MKFENSIFWWQGAAEAEAIPSTAKCAAWVSGGLEYLKMVRGYKIRFCDTQWGNRLSGKSKWTKTSWNLAGDICGECWITKNEKLKISGFNVLEH